MPEKDFRCKNCGKLLAKGNAKNLGIVCSRCKAYNGWKGTKKVEKNKTIL